MVAVEISLRLIPASTPEDGGTTANGAVSTETPSFRYPLSAIRYSLSGGSGSVRTSVTLVVQDMVCHPVVPPYHYC
jgi:hypothetical protein